jgi:hypothetical protein
MVGANHLLHMQWQQPNINYLLIKFIIVMIPMIQELIEE